MAQGSLEEGLLVWIQALRVPLLFELVHSVVLRLMRQAAFCLVIIFSHHLLGLKLVVCLLELEIRVLLQLFLQLNRRSLLLCRVA